MLRNADGGGGCQIFGGEKRYKGVRYNVICITRGWVGVQFSEKKRYVTLEWPLTLSSRQHNLEHIISPAFAIRFCLIALAAL